MRFTRERTGTHTFDLNRDGVAHYGLVADLIADMQRTHPGPRALRLLFNSAQAYVDSGSARLTIAEPARLTPLLEHPSRWWTDVLVTRSS